MSVGTHRPAEVVEAAAASMAVALFIVTSYLAVTAFDAATLVGLAVVCLVASAVLTRFDSDREVEDR